MGMGSQQYCRGWTQIRALEWAGGDCSGRGGDGQEDGGQGETQRPKSGRGTEPRGRQFEGAEVRRDGEVPGAAAELILSTGRGRGWRGRQRATEAPCPHCPFQSPAVASIVALPQGRARGTFRPPQSAPFATTGPQTPGSLPGQAGSQAQSRVGNQLFPPSAVGLASRTITSSKLAKSTMAS